MQKLLSYVRRAVDDYNMIRENDSVVVGLSGGKDSMSLLSAMARLREFYPVKFELCAIFINSGFETDTAPMREFCKSLKVRFIEEKTDIKSIVFDTKKEKNPCFLCGKLRRGALISVLKREHINCLALAHHNDDVIETFLMSVIYESKIDCFPPVTYYEDNAVTVIRPLIYAPESYISSFAKRTNLPIIKNPCPFDNRTKRTEIKNMLSTLSKSDRDVKKRIFAAIRASDIWKK